MKQVRERYRQHRRKQAARLAERPLAEAVAEFNLNGEWDFMDYGLWERRVKVLRVPERWQSTFGTATQGRIGWSYPVSGSIFDFKFEAPVLVRPDAEPLAQGIAWTDLELINDD